MKTVVSAFKCHDYKRESLLIPMRSAISAAGGFPPSVKAGARVLIKPNLLCPARPEEAKTTHPDFVRALIEILRERGVRDIIVGDSPAGAFAWEELWEKTGFAAMAKEEKVNLISFSSATRIELARVGQTPVLAGLDDFDAVINVPKLKTHMLTKITGAVKNTFGLVIGGAKSHCHSFYSSPRKMAVFLAELYKALKPDFTVMDAVVCMEKDGPSSGGVPKQAGLIFAGADAVAVDACACGVYGYKHGDIPTLNECASRGLGVADMRSIDREGDGWDIIPKIRAARSKRSDFLHMIPEPVFFIGTLALNCRPVIVQPSCAKCALCAKNCPKGAIIKSKNGFFVVDGSKCILCMCCVESCAKHAVELVSPAMRITRPLRKLLVSLGLRKH